MATKRDARPLLAPTTGSEPVFPSDPDRGAARALIGKLPGKIRVGIVDLKIHIMSPQEASGRQAFGECRWQEFTLAIDVSIGSPHKAVETLLHEVQHAIWASYKIQDEDKEERTVCLMALGWTQVFRDNAWLLDWIKAGLA